MWGRRKATNLRRIERFLVLVALILAAWMVYLIIQLPTSYRAQNWDVAWVGFDFAMLASLLVSVWAIWKRRQLAIPAAMVTATLLVVDSWFDVVTSQAGLDLNTALLSAVFVELPLAFLLLNFSRRLIHQSIANAHRRAGIEIVAISLARTPLTIFDDE